MSDNKKFGLAGVMGWPVAHSRSPTLHNYWIKHYGLTGAYVLQPTSHKAIFQNKILAKLVYS